MLIYTYKPGLHHIHSVISPETNLKIYRKCIQHNKQYHKSKIYTTANSVQFFDDIVDEVVVVPDSVDTFFQDDLKFYVLQKEKEEYALIDGDIILDNKLSFNSNYDIEFEKLIKDNPNDDYFIKMRKYLLNEGVAKEFPYWENYDFTYNLGIIKVHNKSFIPSFLKEYQKLKKFYQEKIEKNKPEIRANMVIEMATCTYFLSMFLLLNKHSIGVLNKNNNFTHYSGYIEKLKFINRYLSINKKLI